MKIEELLEITINKKASDLHLIVGLPPTVRVNGELFSIPGKETLTESLVKDLIFSILSEEQKEILLVNKELDFSFDYQGEEGLELTLIIKKEH